MPTTKTPTTPTPEAVISEAEWETRRKEIIARIPPKDQRPTKLYAKLAQIYGLIGEIPKRGVNTFHHYSYVKEQDLVDAIRPILSEYGIWIEWSLIWDRERGIIGHERMSQVLKDRDKNIIGEQESLTVLMAEFWFVDGETGETTAHKIVPGYGDDIADKGSNKAQTSLVKYFLMKTFLVSTGDDPEGDSRADERAQRRSQPDVQRSSRQGGRAQPAQGGRQQEASSPQLRQLGELLRRSGISGSKATLDYFAEKLERPFPVEDGDAAGTLQDAIKAMKPDEMGKLIAGLRADVEAQEPADAVNEQPADPDAQAPAESPAGAAPEDEDDAGPIA